jgi:hypothetical protein
MAFGAGPSGRVTLTLKDAEGNTVALNPSTIEISRANPETVVEIPVAAVRVDDKPLTGVEHGAHVTENLGRERVFPAITYRHAPALTEDVVRHLVDLHPGRYPNLCYDELAREHCVMDQHLHES